MKIAIIGAGPAGLAAAWRLVKGGERPEIFEAAPAIGGLARSLTIFGRSVDLGSHIFTSPDARVRAAWDEAIGNRWTEVTVRRGILCESGAVVEYPIRPLNLPAAIGVAETLKCVAGFARARLTPRQIPQSSRDVIVQKYGEPLFVAFFRSYGEKYLGQSNTQVDPAFARYMLGQTPSNLRAQPAPGENANNPKAFRWPKGGTGEIWLGLEKIIKAGGGQIHLRTPISGLHTTGGRMRAVETAGGAADFDHVISSMPLPLLCKVLRPPLPLETNRATGLRMRSTVLVYLLVRLPEPISYSWVYVYSTHCLVGRITNFGMWTGSDAGETLLSFEYWCTEGDSLWQRSDDDLVALATRELHDCGLAAGSTVSDGAVHRAKSTHPAYDLGYQEGTGAVWEQLDKIQGLQSIGRHGRLDLGTIGSSMQMGIEAAERILESRPGWH